MKHFNDKVIIGIDNGYGNIKTANHVFRAGLVKCETDPVFHGDILFYDGHYYLIGEGHKEYNPEKITDDDYFILTLAGIAMELRAERLYEATVHIAAGLPLKWVSQQKKAFTDYLLRKPDVIFEFNREIYHIRISGVSMFPQGYAAIFDKTADMKGMHVLCDIGNGTMNILFMKDGRPDPLKAYTEKHGTGRCVNEIKTAIMDKYHASIDESLIEDVFRDGTAEIPYEWMTKIREISEKYVKHIFDVLRRYDYEPSLMKLHIVGGGGFLVRSFGKFDSERVFINEDICATVKGYEKWAEHQLLKANGNER
ncbi:MAG: ParM/StbA family protein [Clostridia bacterium]|nr:ParM/StbA family protein [Clostridia bacterium]